MIITRSEVKALLSISSVDYDSFIDLNIPMAEQAVCDYCNSDFIDKQFDYFSSSAVSFINSNNSINLTNIGNKKIVANDTIRVYGSLRNDQVFTVDTVNTNSLILNSIDTITDEDEGEGIFISKVKYPVPLKFIVSKMIKYNIDRLTKEQGVKSEKIDDYNITYEDNVNGFPTSIMNQLNVYRQLYKIDLFNCNRGF